MLIVRADGRCERCGRRGRLDADHAREAGDGGPDTWSNLSLLCRSCHDAKTTAFDRGRLIVEALGSGQFEYTLVSAASKTAYRRWQFTIFDGPRIGGRHPTLAERAELEAMEAL